MADHPGRKLPALARAAVSARLHGEVAPVPEGAALEDTGATFVTITIDGSLRGCIGTLEATRPLGADVMNNACAAAFRDPRFEPMTLEELDIARFEVSLLSEAEPMAFESEADLLSQLRPGRDGLVLRWGAHRGVFLPQVWESLPNPLAFFQGLKRKARLATDAWSPKFVVSRFTVEKWKEPRP